MTKSGQAFYIVLALWCLLSCSSVGQEPVTPVLPVYLEINLQQSAYRPLLEPASLLSITEPATAWEQIGYGGILIVHSLQAGQYYAFDLSCPVERKNSVRVILDDLDVYCLQCGTHYEVLAGSGAAIEGVGHSPLRRYQTFFDQARRHLVIKN